MASISSPEVFKAGFWAADEEAAVSFQLSDIDRKLFTHLYYASLVPDSNSFELVVSDPTAKNLSKFTDTLHSKNPPVKALLTVGRSRQDTEIARVFARMASSKESRKKFIDSCIKVARSHRFDGIDLDWEFPENAEEMKNLGKLLEELGAKVYNDNPKLFLTAAVASTVKIDYTPEGSRSYPVRSINDNLDWVNVMCYDYFTPKETGAHAALFSPRSISTSVAFKSWIEAGLQRNKFIMGLPLFGRTWELQNPRLNSIGAPAVGLGPGKDGKMSYSEVEKFNTDNQAMVVYDPDTVSTYSYAETSWIGYDDTRSITVKIRYAQDNGIGGYFIWKVTGDIDLKISKQGENGFTVSIAYCFTIPNEYSCM